MADTNPRVMEMVERELKKNPDISNADLLDKAKKIDPKLGELSARQFNARYPLQVKRALKPKKRKPKSRASTAKRSKGRPQTGDGKQRDGVRKVLLQLARDIGNAERKGDVVNVVAGIDGYVDRVIKAATP